MIQFGDRGFQSIEILIENNFGSTPTQSDLQQWAQSAGLQTVPVLADNNYATWSPYEVDYYIPTIVHFGPDMTVLSIDEGISNPGVFLP